MDIVKYFKSDGIFYVRLVFEFWGEFDVIIYCLRVDIGVMWIERWICRVDFFDIYWRILFLENVMFIFGDFDSSCIVDILDGKRCVYFWMLSCFYDVFGNVIEYIYKEEDVKGVVDVDGFFFIWEQNCLDDVRCCQKYIKWIKYGNRVFNCDLLIWEVLMWF